MLNHPVFRSILNDPADDQTRLVFADWMEEQGSDYAQFIRLQIEIAQRLKANESIDHVKPLINRAKLIFSEHHNRWNQVIYRLLNENGVIYRRRRGDVRRWKYRRGFVESVEMSGDCFVNHWDVVSQIGPINFVLIERASRGLFDGWKRPEQVSHLCVRNSDDLELMSMAQSGLFDGLKVLEFRNSLVGFGAAQALAEMSESIEKLVFRGSPYAYGQGATFGAATTSLAPVQEAFTNKLIFEPIKDERNRLNCEFVDSTMIELVPGANRHWPYQPTTVERLWKFFD